jgi:UDP-N-acetylglucosamine acyltransferase
MGSVELQLAASFRERSVMTATTVHPTAIVHGKARLGAGAMIGPYAVIGEHVAIGERTQVGSHCVVEGRTTIGQECQIFTGAVLGSAPQDRKYHGEETTLVIGDRNKIREYVTMNPGTEGGGGQTVVGSECLFMAYSHVAHDCFVGNQVVLANSAALAGHITVADRATIGGLVGVHQFVRIGEMAFIGGCSRVVQDVPPFATVVGYPAKVYGMNNEGLRRAGVDHDTKQQLHRAFRILFHSKLSMSHAVEQVERDLPAPCAELARLLTFVRESKRGVCRA